MGLCMSGVETARWLCMGNGNAVHEGTLQLEPKWGEGHAVGGSRHADVSWFAGAGEGTCGKAGRVAAGE